MLKETSKSLRSLPKPPSKDPVGEVIHMVASFTRDLARCIEGTPEEHGLLQSIRPLQEGFRRAIRATAPDFRAYESDANREDFLTAEEQSQPDVKVIYIDEVMKLARMCVIRFPFHPFTHLLMQGENSRVTRSLSVRSFEELDKQCDGAMGTSLSRPL